MAHTQCAASFANTSTSTAGPPCAFAACLADSAVLSLNWAELLHASVVCTWCRAPNEDAYKLVLKGSIGNCQPVC